MSQITTHVLDTSRGKPASGLPVLLEFSEANGTWRPIWQGRTDNDGRVKDTLLFNTTELPVGVYRLTFDTSVYFSATHQSTFYPYVTVAFELNDAAQHYHVPLLISPFGYSTYRGS
jgi:5-hydroxyisourate hydrolase